MSLLRPEWALRPPISGTFGLTPFGPRSPHEGHTCPTGTGTECPDRRCWVGTMRPAGRSPRGLAPARRRPGRGATPAPDRTPAPAAHCRCGAGGCGGRPPSPPSRSTPLGLRVPRSLLHVDGGRRGGPRFSGSRGRRSHPLLPENNLPSPGMVPTAVEFEQLPGEGSGVGAIHDALIAEQGPVQRELTGRERRGPANGRSACSSGLS